MHGSGPMKEAGVLGMCLRLFVLVMSRLMSFINDCFFHVYDRLLAQSHEMDDYFDYNIICLY